MLQKSEIQKLQAYLRHSFTNQALTVTPQKKDLDKADVRLGDRVTGQISLDDEDGDRSFSFEMKIPVERAAIQEYLRLLFGNDALTLLARTKKTDSVELLNGSEFLGIISIDGPKAKSFTLQMAILDFDLDDY